MDIQGIQNFLSTTATELGIKILAAIANPANLDEYGLQTIDVEQEVTILKEALAGQDTFQLTVLPAPCTLDNLARELQDGYDVPVSYTHLTLPTTILV